MLTPYQKIMETDTRIVLQQNPFYSWFYVLLLLLILVGLFINNRYLHIAIACLAIAYAIARLALGFRYMLLIRHGSKQGPIELTGNKYSFRHPLRITLKK